jgi:N-carbamoyl-L-amino-acid hydrolase
MNEQTLSKRFVEGWEQLAPIGQRSDGGYDRFSFTDADMALRQWFIDEAQKRNLTVEVDRNANLWAWWGEPGDTAIVTGSHLDSVPGGGAFDGPLGVWSGFLAIDLLQSRGRPPRPLAVVNWSDEEGARFGVACMGSRLATGTLSPGDARRLRDQDGVSFEDALRHVGYDPQQIGADDERLKKIGAFVELHVEQGRALIDFDEAVGAATVIWPHGRWRIDFVGEANHAGTARLEDRRDPVLSFSLFALAVREEAQKHNSLATLGRAKVTPNATNGVAANVASWLDARAPDEETLDRLVKAIVERAHQAGNQHGVSVSVSQESHTKAVVFDELLRNNMVEILGPIPQIPTGAGHDAGILAARIPTAMLFVRNPSGVSHSPQEYAELSDCVAGVYALAKVLETLAWA